MKVFGISEDGVYENRINFVDANNVVLGYNYESQCCEDFYFYITKNEPVKIEKDYEEISINELNNDSLYFDKSYNKNLDMCFGDYEKNGIAFKVLGGEDDLFIVFVNCHNGHYCHGFDMKDSESKIIFKGIL